MKTKLLIAIGLCFALIHSKLRADDPVSMTQCKDTLFFSPVPDCQVFLIGNDLSALSMYSKMDSIKSLFLDDLSKAREQHLYPEGSRLTHYFVHPNGKRRLKAENADYLEKEIDPEAEKRSLSLELLPFAYFIYDLEKDITCEIYLNDPTLLLQLEAVSFTDAIRSLNTDKKSMRKFYRIDLEKNGTEWQHKQEIGQHLDFLEMTPSFGFGIIGGAWSPVMGAHLSLTFNDKYGFPEYKTGASLSGHLFADYSNKRFSNFYSVMDFEINFMVNLSKSKSAKAKWFGLQGGLLKSKYGGSLEGAYKVGVISEGFSVLNYSFDLIRDKNKNYLYGITLRLPF
ncbi:MAG: hypothetical protein IPO39_13175 [Bacteroidetes bacterium]|nr:hypothetical protein [Bacteroidota bacterium]MBK9525652.1 hypothetical protein [Bacteroidota bacterium]MBK9540786.1 hypothetical protein [Bacteroidota bacterium]MBP6649068.1 hypothetical protein [Bacteroidia bacterium]